MSAKWIDAMSLTDAREGDATSVELEGRDIAVYRVGEQVLATDNICTHGHARLCDGFLEGYEIECPLHQGRFDIRTGRPLCGPVVEHIRTYPVRVVDGRVLIALD